MDPATVDLSPVQELVAVLRDVGIVGLLAVFVVGLFKGWWTMRVRTDGAVAGDEQTLNKVVLSFPQARRIRRRRRR